MSENTSKIWTAPHKKYTGFSDMRNSNFWYQNIEFPISKNQKYFPLTFFYYMFKNLNLFISENQIFFARNSAFLVLFLYQKIIFWHQKFDFLISENDFFIPKHLLRSCEHFERLNISVTSEYISNLRFVCSKAEIWHEIKHDYKTFTPHPLASFLKWINNKI